MHIGVFLGGFEPTTGGGYTIQAEIARAAVERAVGSNHQITFISDNPDGLRDELARRDLSILALPSKLARFYSRITRIGRTKTTTIEQVSQAAGIDMLWFVGAEAVQVNMPYIATVLDLQHRRQPHFPEVSSNGQWNHRETFLTQYLRRATFVIVGTETGREEVADYYGVPRERIRINPHPTPRFFASQIDDNDVLERHKITRPYLFYPAQFWPHKNHVNLLLAVRQLIDQGCGMQLVLAGSEKGNGKYLRDVMHHLKLQDAVRILGFVPSSDLPALYRNAFALTYTTFFGPENLPPLEAFSMGCPVIASRVAGATEQLGDAALLVDPVDPANIAANVLLLRDDDNLRQSLVARGRTRAAERSGMHFVDRVFSWFDEFEPTRRCWAGSTMPECDSRGLGSSNSVPHLID